MNNDNNLIIISLLISILGSVIANIITNCPKSIGLLLKRLFTKGKVAHLVTNTPTTKVAASTTKLSLLDIVFVGIDLVPIALNSFLLYTLLNISTPVTRIEVLAILFISGTIVYWLRDMVLKIQRHNP